MTRTELLNDSQGMMSERGELFANPAFGRGDEAVGIGGKRVNNMVRMVIRWLRIVDSHIKEARQ